MVGVPAGGAAHFRIILPAADVVLRIRQAGQTGLAALELERAGADFGNYALIVFVQRREIAADVGQNVRIGFDGGVGLHEGIEERLVNPRAVVRGQLAAAFGGGGAAGGLVGQAEMTGHDIALEIILLRAGEAAVLGVERIEPFRGRAGLVVVGDEIDLVRAAVGGAVLPVVNDIVAEIEPAGVGARFLVQPARQAPVSPGAMREEIVVEAADVAADAGRIAMLRAGRILLVPGGVQRLGNQACAGG